MVWRLEDCNWKQRTLPGAICVHGRVRRGSYGVDTLETWRAVKEIRICAMGGSESWEGWRSSYSCVLSPGGVHWLGAQASLAPKQALPFRCWVGSGWVGFCSYAGVAAAVKGKKSGKLMSPLVGTPIPRQTCQPFSQGHFTQPLSQTDCPTGDKGIWEKGLHGFHLASPSPVILAPPRSLLVI